MSSKTVVSRTYPRTPYAAFDKNGVPLNLEDVLNGVKADAELIAHYALKEMTEQNRTSRYQPTLTDTSLLMLVGR